MACYQKDQKDDTIPFPLTCKDRLGFELLVV